MQWSQRIGHGIVRRMRKVQGFFRFYGGKIRYLWRRSGRPWQKLTTRVALVGLFVGLFVSVYWGWSALSRLSGLQPGETLIVAPATQDAEGSSAPGAVDAAVPASDVRVEVSPHRPAPPVNWRPAVGVEALIRPVAATGTAPPGWRRDGQTGHWYYEPAVQLHAPRGSIVQAALPGVVTAVEPTSGGGVKVTLQHDGGLVTVYENLYDVTVAVGNSVSGYARLGRLANIAAATEQDSSMLFAVYREDDALDVFALWESN